MNLVIHDCNKEIIEFLLNHGANAQCEDRTTGTSALQMAVIRGNLLTTQLLINYGADTKTLSKVCRRIRVIVFLFFRNSFVFLSLVKHFNN